MDHDTVQRIKAQIKLIEKRLHYSPTTGVRLAHSEVRDLLEGLQKVVDFVEGE